MRIAQLSLRNYRVFEHVELELPSRVIGIFGPNGAGKSTLVESVLYALYGRARTRKQEIRTQGLLTDCEVRMVFEHGGSQYEVRRIIRGKGHQTDAELYVGGLQLAAGVTEVDAEIRRLLHMDLAVFRASVFAEQKQLDAFSDVTSRDRKEMVLRLLGIRPVDVARASARRQSREVREQAERLSGALPDAAELDARLREVTEAATDADRQATTASEAAKGARKRAERAGSVFEELDVIRERFEVLEVRRRDASEEARKHSGRFDALKKRRVALEKDLRGLPDLEAESEHLQGAGDRLALARRLVDALEEVAATERELGALEELDAAGALAALETAQREATRAGESLAGAEADARRAAADLERALETLDRAGHLDSDQPCPTCGQPLGAGFDSYIEHCRTEARSLKRDATEAGKAVTKAKRERKAADVRLKEVAAEASRVQLLTQRRESLEERLSALGTRSEQLLAPFEGKRPDLPALESEAARERELDRRLADLRASARHLENAKADLEEAAKAVTECTSRVEELGREAATLSFDPEQHSSARKERDEAVRLLESADARERQANSERQRLRESLIKLEAEVEQARILAQSVRDMRDQARYLERVSTLLNGFRDHLVARIGPELSRETEVLFRELTNHEYEDVRIDDDTLAIQISDSGTYFPIERFSGSETDLANLALRVAISMHLSRVSGADVGLMVLDEVLGALDAERKDLLVRAMGRLSERFHQLFVITHAEQVKDQFPTSIEIRKVGRRRSEATLV